MKKSLVFLTALFSSTVAMAQTTPEQNKANALAFYYMAFNQQKLQDAVVDIFRFDENGKIVEHWDVIQSVSENTESGRSIF